MADPAGLDWVCLGPVYQGSAQDFVDQDCSDHSVQGFAAGLDCLDLGSVPLHISKSIARVSRLRLPSSVA